VVLLAVFLLVLLTAFAAQRAESYHQKMVSTYTATEHERLEKKRAFWDAHTGVGITVVVVILVWLLMSGIPDKTLFGPANDRARYERNGFETQYLIGP
jgi:hypothetical protein